MSVSNLFKINLLVCGCLGLQGCRDYQVTLNERPIYQPPTLVEKIALADAALETCIEQVIQDQQVTAIKDLWQLRCSNAGVRSLAGLEQLAYLKELDLSDNGIIKIDSLFELPELSLLRLADNEKLDCEQLKRLKEKNGALKIEAPTQCEGTL